MSESKLWQLIKPVESYGHIERVEVTMPIGMSDTFYKINDIPGWCELKYVREYPKRISTPIRVNHFTEDQKRFLGRMIRHGYKARVLVMVEDDLYLFGSPALFSVGKMQRDVMHDNALVNVRRGDKKLAERIARGLVYG